MLKPRHSNLEQEAKVLCVVFKLADRMLRMQTNGASKNRVELKRSFSRSLRPNFGFHLVLTSFHLEFSSFWISMLLDLGDLSVLENGSLKYFENVLKSIQIFQRLMGGMNRRGRWHLNQIRSAVRSDFVMFCSHFPQCLFDHKMML